MATNDSTIPLKRCSKKEHCVHPEAKDGWLPATTEYFHRNRRTKDGLRCNCKVCNCASRQLWGVNNPDKVRDSNRQYRASNPEKMREIERRWRTNNLERERERDRIRYACNPQKRKGTVAHWRAMNPNEALEVNRRSRARYPEKSRTHSRNRKARKRQAAGTHTAADIAMQIQRQKNYCYYCGCQMTDVPNKPHSRTVDHVVPLTRGGRNSPDNLVIACSLCNSSKQDKLPHEWSKGGRLL